MPPVGQSEFRQNKWPPMLTGRPSTWPRFKILIFLYYIIYLSILFNAITKGHFLLDNIFIDSIVYASKPCIKSITKIAKSHKLEPLDLKFAKLS